MSDADQLVPDLLLFGFQLHIVRQWLPAASSAYSEVLAERLKPVLGRFHYLENETFHIVLFLFCYLDIDNVSRNCEFYENHCPIHVGK